MQFHPRKLRAVSPSLLTSRFLWKWPLTPRLQLAMCQEVHATTAKGQKPSIHQWMWNEREHFCCCDSQLTQPCWVCGCCSFPFRTSWPALICFSNTETVHFSTCCWSSFSSCCIVHLVTFYGPKINFCGQEENCFTILTHTNISTTYKSFFLVRLATNPLSNQDHFPKENKPDLHLLSHTFSLISPV